MKYFSYVISRDYGFAPNPFFGFCTLATCKPKIRENAQIGDWIFGTGSVALGCKDKLIYAMQVTNKITYDTYCAYIGVFGQQCRSSTGHFCNEIF